MKESLMKVMGQVCRDSYLTVCQTINQIIVDEDFAQLKYKSLEEIVWTVDILLTNSRSEALKTTIVNILRQVSTNVA
jgi:hypothetical protein